MGCFGHQMTDYDTWKSYAPDCEPCLMCGGNGYNPRDRHEPVRAHCPSCRGTGRATCECGSDAVTRLPRWIDQDESPVCSQCLAEANPEL